MADNLTTATIDVRANTRGMEKDILKALRTVEFSEINTKKSSQALGRITGQVSEFNKSLEASNARVVAFGASAGAIFAVEKALSAVVSSTIEVEKKLADINVLLNLSSANLEKFGSNLFGIAKNTAQSFSVVAEAATELSRQGLGVEETLKRTNAALILTRLSGLDAKSSVEALTATLNSFSGSALDAVEVVNKLANVDAAFAVSSADLANAISRVGSTAVDAGVSLDELIALVTAAQQTTARGGAVIGNSFKTIFTRLQRGKVQDLLGSLGVDTSEGQSAISLLQQLASTYDKLGASQKSYVAEQVGGVFQINILKAALSDLGKEYSIYGRALDTSLSSTDQAIQRNKLLNETISALSSQAFTNLEQAASKIGSIVFEPNAKGFLKGINDLLSSFNNLDAESAGGKLMAGFFKGVGDFIGGPGAVLATAVLIKLFARLTQFAAGSAKELLGTNKAAQQQAAIEQSILGILQKNSQFTSQILSGKITTVQAEKQMLDYLTAQSNILREQERLSKVIGANLSRAGVSIGKSGIPMTAAPKTKAAASGYIPNFATDMAVGQAMENAGAKEHGYKAGKARKTTIHDGNGKSFKSFVNSKEDVKTFTNAAGKKATVVRPPNGFGENTQYAANGFVPNFASVEEIAKLNSRVKERLDLSQSPKGDKRLSGKDLINLSGRSYKQKQFPINPGESFNNYETRVLQQSSSLLGKNYLSGNLLRFSTSAAVDGFNIQKNGNETLIDLLEVKGGKNWNPASVLNKFLRALPENYLSKNPLDVFTSNRDNITVGSTLVTPYLKEKSKPTQKKLLSKASGFIPNFASAKASDRMTQMVMDKFYAITDPVQFKKEYDIQSFKPAALKALYRERVEGGVSTLAGRAGLANQKAAAASDVTVKDLKALDYTMIHAGSEPFKRSFASYTKADEKTGKKTKYVASIGVAGLNTKELNNSSIQERVGNALVGQANSLADIFNPTGGTRFSSPDQLSNTGSVYSAAGTVFESAIRGAFNVPAKGQGDRIDFPNPSESLRRFFPGAVGEYEAKITDTPENRASALSKYIAVNGLSSGFIPNFVKSGLSFSHKDKDEFGFSEIQAIMSGKKVGSFSYAEDKPGLVDVGDFTVNKSERGKGIGTELYKEAIRRNAGKKMKGQLLPQMNRLLQKIKNGEPVSAETLYPQIKRADLAKSSVFEVYGHKGMQVEKMTRDQFSSFVNAKINELKKDPKKLQNFFGNVEADEYGGLGVDLQTQHASGFIPNFSSALNEAISREQSAGLSKSQIYVDKHSSLKNKNNPMGLMVANRRDEPGGGIQGIRRAKKEGVDPKTYGGAMSGGFVPNFATGPIKPSKDYLDALKAAELFSSKLGKAAKSVDKFDKEISETDGSANQAPGKFSKTKDFLSNNALTIGFGLQAAAGMAGEFAGGDDTQAGRTTKAVAGGIGDIASFAGAGLQVAGPWGAAAGFAVGLGKAALDVTKALKTKVPDMERALQNSADSMNRFSESGQKLLTLNEQYGDALMSGNPTQAADIMIKTQKAYAEELSKLTQVQRDSMISAIAQGKGQEEYAKILGEMQNSVKAQETATQLTKFSESGGLFSGPDKKLLAGLDKGLALDFTKGMDTSSVVAALEKAASSLENPNLGTENQALDLMKSLASSESLSGDQRENLNKMIEAFATAAETTDLSSVAEGFLKSIKEKPKSDADAKRAVEARKAQIEAEAAKAKKEIEIREKTNSMLLKLQADTEAVYRRYNNSVEDFISSIETASQMMSAAGQFREEYLSQGGANKSITDPIKERNIVNKSNADLKVAIYKSQQETSVDFIKGTKDILSGLQTDSAKLGAGQSANDQANQLLKIKSNLEKALLPIQSMIQAGDYEGAKSETEKVFKNLKPEERSAIGEEKLTGAVEQLKDGIDKGARSQDLLVKNSQKDLAIQAQQLVFQKAMSKMTQAQNFGGTATSLLDPNGDQGGAFDTAIKALGNLKALGYNQAGLKQGKDQQVVGGDKNTWGLNGQKPSKGMASDLLKFYKSMSEFAGESVMSTESKDFGVIVQTVQSELRNRLDAFKQQGEGVIDQAVISRLETTLGELGGDNKVAQLKVLKETGFANISGETIFREALKGYTGGALEGLDPSLKGAFKETSDESAAATLLLLDDQKNQTKSILAGQTAQTDSLVAGLEAIVNTGYGTNEMLSQQPSQIAQAIGAILEKGQADREVDQSSQKIGDLTREIDKIESSKQGNNEQLKSAKNEQWLLQDRAALALRESKYGEDDLNNLTKKNRAQAIVDIQKQAAEGGSSMQVYGSMLAANGLDPFGVGTEIAQKAMFDPEGLSRMVEESKKFLEAIELNKQAQEQGAIIQNKEKENESLSKKQEEIKAQEKVERKKQVGLIKNQGKAASAADAAKQFMAPQSSGSVAGKNYIDKNQAARQEAANKAALAENLGVQGGGNLLTEQQKKNRARTSGAELTYNEFVGRRTSFESRALTEFGGANQKSYESLIKQGAVPSFEKFKNVYEELGGKGNGKDFFESLKATILGIKDTTTPPSPTPAPANPTTPASKVPVVLAPAAESTMVKRTAIGSTIGSSLGGGTKDLTTSRLGPSANAPQWFQDAYNRKPGSLGGGIKDLTTSRLGPSANAPQWFQDAYNRKPGSLGGGIKDLRTPRLGASETSPQWMQDRLNNKGGGLSATSAATDQKLIKPQIAQEQTNKIQPGQQQDPSQLISSILTTVNQIASELQKQVNPTGAGGEQSGVIASNGGISVSTPVNLTVNSQNGENKTEAVSVADKIKSDLTAFLSSKEFMDRVTTIAKNATGNPQPPTQIT